MKKTKHFSLRINADILNKFRYIAKYNGRSGSGQILYLIRTFIADFESRHGKISIEDEVGKD